MFTAKYKELVNNVHDYNKILALLGYGYKLNLPIFMIAIGLINISAGSTHVQYTQHIINRLASL